jgi:hypothetical protein
MPRKSKNNKKVDPRIEMGRKAAIRQGLTPGNAVARISGKGGYYSDKVVPFMRKIIPDGTFARGGAFVGDRLGNVAGNMVIPGSGSVAGGLASKAGNWLGSGLSRILGFGDYEVSNNSLIKTGGAIMPGEAIPAFGVMGQATTVRHREYLMDIVVPSTPSSFTNTSFSVNPGDPATFPWLASMAQQYQQYKFNGLVFEFKTLSSDITAGGALGAVIMASNYDVVEASYADKISMENSQFAVSAKPSCSQIHTMECLPSSTANNLFYVRGGTAVTLTGQDNRFYDLANFQLATSGLPGSAGTVLGELWVSYDVSLYKPILNAFIPGATVKGASSISKTVIYGVAPVVQGNSVTASGSTLTFLYPGQYLVTSFIGGTGLTGPAFSGTATAQALASSFSGSTTLTCQAIQVKVTAANQTLILDYSTSSSVTLSQTMVGPFSYSLTA